MNFAEFLEKLPDLPDEPTREQWDAAVKQAEALVPQVDEADRDLARTAIGDTLIQVGAFLGFVRPD